MENTHLRKCRSMYGSSESVLIEALAQQQSLTICQIEEQFILEALKNFAHWVTTEQPGQVWAYVQCVNLLDAHMLLSAPNFFILNAFGITVRRRTSSKI